MKTMTRLLAIFLMIFLLPISASCQEKSYSWYCKRNNEHIQPHPGAEMSFVSDYNVYWCDRNNKSYDSGDKVIYLTFDAGYENGNIAKILNELRKENVQATFFVLDNLIKSEKELVKRMIDEGHTVANHTMKHKDMTKMKCKEDFEQELKSLEELYYNNFGECMAKLYRPPEGKFNESNLRWADELGYKTVFWSFAYADWDNSKQPSHEFALKKIFDNVHNGEIMLLHPTSSTNAEIMHELIVKLKAQGYRFGNLNEIS